MAVRWLCDALFGGGMSDLPICRNKNKQETRRLEAKNMIIGY